MDPSKLRFEILPNEGMIVVVTGANGKRLRASIRVAILDVTDTGKFQPNDPSLPVLEFKAQVIAEVKAIDE